MNEQNTSAGQPGLWAAGRKEEAVMEGNSAESKTPPGTGLRAALLLALAGISLVAALLMWQQNPVLSIGLVLLAVQAALTERSLWFTLTRPGYAASAARRRTRRVLYALPPIVITIIVVSFFI